MVWRVSASSANISTYKVIYINANSCFQTSTHRIFNDCCQYLTAINNRRAERNWKGISCPTGSGPESTPAFHHQRRRHPARSDDVYISRDQRVTNLDLFICWMLSQWVFKRPPTSSKAAPSQLLSSLNNLSVGWHLGEERRERTCGRMATIWIIGYCMKAGSSQTIMEQQPRC